MGKIKFLQGFLFGIIFVVFVFCMVVFICAIINDVSFLEQLDIWFSHDADVVKDTLTFAVKGRSLL